MGAVSQKLPPESNETLNSISAIHEKVMTSLYLLIQGELLQQMLDINHHGDYQITICTVWDLRVQRKMTYIRNQA